MANSGLTAVADDAGRARRDGGLAAFAWQDLLRRRRGAWLEALGLGPRQTPATEVAARPGYRLLDYGGEGEAPVLIVPAPIKQAYIFDLLPARSVVRQCRERARQRVFMLHWTPPGAAERGLAEYVGGDLDGAVAAVTALTGRAPVLIGHSLGGTFAALYAALHPERLRGLVLLEAPLKFGQDAFAAMVRRPQAQALLEGDGPVPGSFLNVASVSAAPEAFVYERLVDRLACLSQPQAAEVHLRVERWTLDEMPMARRLFADVVGQLFRDDRFMRGELVIAGQPARPEHAQVPLLAVADPRSRVVPAQALRAFFDQVRHPAKRWLEYHGDVGVGLQHVGVLVGESAHRALWPAICDWIRERD